MDACEDSTIYDQLAEFLRLAICSNSCITLPSYSLPNFG